MAPPNTLKNPTPAERGNRCQVAALEVSMSDSKYIVALYRGPWLHSTRMVGYTADQGFARSVAREINQLAEEPQPDPPITEIDDRGDKRDGSAEMDWPGAVRHSYS